MSSPNNLGPVMREQHDRAAHVSLLAAPIFAALLQRATLNQLHDKEWQREARGAAIRQAVLLWQEALEAR